MVDCLRASRMYALIMMAALVHVFPWLLVHIHLIFGSTTTVGKMFLLAPPKLAAHDAEMVFHLFTPMHHDFKVKITTHLFQPGSELNVTLTLKRLKILNFVINKYYQHETSIGKVWTFKLEAEKRFGLHVVLSNGQGSVGIFQVFPVIGWGTVYFAVTLSFNPTLQLMTNLGPNDITIYLRSEFPNNFSFAHNGQQYKHGNNLKVKLEKWEAYILSFCENEKLVKTGSMTGTKIVGTLNFGLISGSCLGITDAFQCNDKKETDYRPNGSAIAIEMIFPRQSYGTEFILFSILNSTTPSYFVVVAGEEDTVIWLHTDHLGGKNSLQLRHQGDWNKVEPVDGSNMLTSNKGIQVAHVARTACATTAGGSPFSSGDVGDPSLCMLVSTSLFYDIYYFSVPSNITAEHYLAMIILQVNARYLILDGYHMSASISWTPVMGKKTWSYGEYKISNGSHVMRTTDRTRFGFYMIGLSTKFSYLNPGGYIVSLINGPCNVSVLTLKQGDFIDNDCDRRVDEEIKDERDNDGDGKIDEDLGKGPDVDGDWAEWSSYECTRNCSEYRPLRSRQCTNPTPEFDGLDCEGPFFEYGEPECYLKETCPENCTKFFWGIGCIESCINCNEDCNKFNGSCQSCKAGFDHPQTSCLEQCRPYTFGLYCKGDCIRKCSADCKERVTGTCAGSEGDTSLYPPMMLFGLLPICFFFFWLCARTKEGLYIQREMSLRSLPSSELDTFISVREPKGPKDSISTIGSLQEKVVPTGPWPLNLVTEKKVIAWSTKV